MAMEDMRFVVHCNIRIRRRPKMNLCIRCMMRCRSHSTRSLSRHRRFIYDPQTAEGRTARTRVRTNGLQYKLGPDSQTGSLSAHLLLCLMSDDI